MGKFSGIVFVTDLDGTLLTKDKKISQENLDAINYFKNEGGIFTVATGRMPFATKRILYIIKPNAPCICANGACFYDAGTDKILWGLNIDKSVMELVHYIDTTFNSVGIEVASFDKIYFCKKSSATEQHRLAEKLEDTGDGFDKIPKVFSKILLAEKDEMVFSELIKGLKSHPKSKDFTLIRSDNAYYEILPKGSNKATLFKKLSEIVGIKTDRTVAVGDNENDIELIKNAKIGFAVSNATIETKAAAKYIAPDNHQNAIAYIIKGIEEGKFNV